ncbi:MAG TPA: ribosome rescue protein RqcH [Candidatus Nanoarchaeia archaeon]|nr:ribosome rescue protein RqcH [Candidatus Nanoarchaeia archaeon]
MLSSLDIMYIVRELDSLVGSIVDKVFQIDPKEFILQLHKSGEGKKLLKIIAGEALFLTKTKGDTDAPSGFAMFLRKHLEQSRITSIEQHSFERIVEINFSKGSKMIIELFSHGNLSLIENDKIVACLEEREWKDRTIKKGSPYEYPPAKINAFKLDMEEFSKLSEESEKDSIVKVLATELSFGGKYAEEICKRAGIDKKKKRIDTNKIFKIYRTLKSVQIKANIAYKKELDFSPFVLEMDEEFEKEYFKTFNECTDYFYSQTYYKKDEVKGKVKLKELAEKQKGQLELLEKRSDEYKRIGDLIFENYNEIESLIGEIRKNKWNVKNPNLIELKKSEAKFVIKFGNLNITIDIEKTVPQNATFYYDIAKKSRKKIEGSRKSYEYTLKTIENYKSKTKQVSVQVEERKKEWYEKYRWFTTSEGKLVIGGRDATTNDILVKKHLDKNDIVFHTEAPGSPFVVIKSENKEIFETEKEEAAQFCVTNSRAWSKGIATDDVFAFKPDQVKKDTSLPKGSFMVYGDREYFRPIIEQAVGLTDPGIVMGGPLRAIKKHCKVFFVVRHGDEKKSDTAKKIKHFFDKHHKTDLNEIMQALPPGECKIIKS